MAKGPMIDGHHCWNEPAAEMFRVRGLNYLDDGKKVSSERSLCRLLAVDFLKGPLGTDFSHIASRDHEGVMHNLLEKHSTTRPPFVVIINFQIQFDANSSGCMAFYWVRREDDESDGAARLFRYLMDVSGKDGGKTALSSTRRPAHASR